MLHDGIGKYDVVTSNANLNEFTRNALYEYLTIFSRAMKDDGIFLIQCTGFPAHGSTEDLMEVLNKFGFASLFCGMADENLRPDMPITDKYRSLGLHRKKFALNNLILVKKGHPHYEANVGLKNYSHGFASDFPRLSHIYEGGTEENPRDLAAGLSDRRNPQDRQDEAVAGAKQQGRPRTVSHAAKERLRPRRPLPVGRLRRMHSPSASPRRRPRG